MKRIPWALSGLALTVAVVSLSAINPGVAQHVTPPDGRLVPPAGVAPAAPSAPRPPSPFEVSPQAGPWMVLAASYTGPHAVYLAEQVVRQLRERHRLPAYIWNFADQQRRKEEEDYNRMLRNNPNVPYRRRFTRIEEQCGVVVGGYPSSEAASNAMKKIKQLPAPEVRTPSGEDASDRIVLAGEQDPKPGEAPGFNLRNPLAGKNPNARTLDQVKRNPFTRAFVIRNPAVRHQHVDQTAKVDPAWKHLNSHEPYNLLKCRKNWTLVIKFYEGPGVLQSNNTPKDEGFLAKLGFGSRSREVLDATGKQAHELARLLREQPFNLEAYVLHTRHGSIVTVGGFDNLNDQQMQAEQQRLSRWRLDRVGSAHALFSQPMPMRIPRL